MSTTTKTNNDSTQSRRIPPQFSPNLVTEAHNTPLLLQPRQYSNCGSNARGTVSVTTTKHADQEPVSLRTVRRSVRTCNHHRHTVYDFIPLCDTESHMSFFFFKHHAGMPPRGLEYAGKPLLACSVCRAFHHCYYHSLLLRLCFISLISVCFLLHPPSFASLILFPCFVLLFLLCPSSHASSLFSYFVHHSSSKLQLFLSLTPAAVIMHSCCLSQVEPRS
jgi:hypothetical protein